MMRVHRLPLLTTATLRFTTRLGMDLLLQFRLRELGAPLFVVSLLSSVRGGISTFMSPFWGSISDKRGKRKAIILLSAFGSAGFTPLYLVATHPWQVLLVTAAVAFFASGFNPVAMALSTEYSSKNSSHARELSLLNSSNSLGMLLSRFLVGLLLLYLTVKSAMGVLVILTGLSVLPAFFVRDVVKRERNASEKSGALKSFQYAVRMMGKNGLWALYVSSFLRQFGTSGTLSLAAIYLTEQIGLSKSAVGFMSAINPMLQIPSHLLFARIIEKTRSKLVAALGMLLSAGVALLFLVGNSPLEIGLAYALLGVAFGAFINGAGVFITKVTDSQERAQALGLLNSFRQIGFMTGPVVAGALATISYDLLFSVMIMVMLAGGTLTAAFARESELVQKKKDHSGS